MEHERRGKVISWIHCDELREDVPKLGEGPPLTIEDTEHVLVQISATPMFGRAASEDAKGCPDRNQDAATIHMPMGGMGICARRRKAVCYARGEVGAGRARYDL